MTYGKIKTDKSIMQMPNPVHLSIANPTEEKKALIAQLDNWLPLKYTDPPSYDPESSYLSQSWEEQTIESVKWAVRVWEVKPIEPESESELAAEE